MARFLKTGITDEARADAERADAEKAVAADAEAPADSEGDLAADSIARRCRNA